MNGSNIEIMKKALYFLFVLIMGVLYSCKEDEQEPLRAEFSSNKQTVAAGETVYFMDKSAGSPVRWDWELEGGEPAKSNLFSPEVVFNQPGKYSVKLKVGRGPESSVKEVTEYITVLYPDEILVDFKADKVQALSDEEISFSDLSVGFPQTWEWVFTPQSGTPMTSTEQNPKLTFAPGIYSVKLTVSNPETSASKTKENYLTVIDKNSVAADFEAQGRMIIEGGTVMFGDKTLGRPTQWNWTFEGGTPSTSGDQNPIVTYKTAGKYKVTLVASNELNTSTKEETGYVIVLPAQDLVLFSPFDGDGKDLGPNTLNSEVLIMGENMDVNFKAPARKEGFYSAEFTSKDGKNYAFLSVPDSPKLDFQASPVTTSFWVKTSNTTATNMGVFQQGAGPNAREDKENRQTWFRFQKSSPYFRYIIEYTGQAGNWTDYKTKSMSDGEWHHYVCVHNSGSTYVYLDGVKVAEALNKPLKPIDPSPYFIGGMYRVTDGARAYESFMDGCIDDYVVYNRAFTAEEAKALYDSMK